MPVEGNPTPNVAKSPYVRCHWLALAKDLIGIEEPRLQRTRRRLDLDESGSAGESGRRRKDNAF